jgi:hypothetical protein
MRGRSRAEADQTADDELSDVEMVDGHGLPVYTSSYLLKKGAVECLPTL